jgi:hypothetical protein
MLAAVVGGGGAVVGAELRPEAVAGWHRYVAATEQRREAEQARSNAFLALDLTPTATADRRAVLAGQRVIHRVAATRANGEAIAVPSALVHHWRGAVLVRGMTVDALIRRLQDSPPPQADVLKASVLSRGSNSMKVYLRLRRTKIVTVVYDTEHQVTFQAVSAARASSASVATRIAQLENAGTAQERALAPGDDSGYLWRLNAYWRYEQVPDGVIAECESLTLSRAVPFGLGTITAPIISSTARESMDAALSAVAALANR